MDIPNKKPQIYKEMGLYNSTMAISKGFTVGLNANNSFLSIRWHYLMSTQYRDCLSFGKFPETGLFTADKFRIDCLVKTLRESKGNLSKGVNYDQWY
jgi:hypothetical protein